MKFSKLALASVAALGLAGVAQADPTYYVEESLEKWSSSPEFIRPQSGANELGNKDNGGAVWFGADSEDTAILQYQGNAPRPTGANKFPTKNDSATTEGDWYLKVSNSSTLWRMLTPYSWEGDEPTAFPVAVDEGVTVGEGLFVDTLVQFTPSEDAPIPEPGSKLIVWMNTNGVLCVTASKLTPVYNEGLEAYEPTYEDKFDFVTSKDGLLTNTWYRLTVKAYTEVLGDMGAGVRHGFKVYIDGSVVSSADAAIDTSTEESEDYVEADEDLEEDINAGKVFLSLSSASSATLSAVGFKGEGLVDDLLVSDLDPIAEEAPAGGIDFTLTWGEGVSAVWYAINDGDLVEAEDGKTIKLADGKTITITADPEAWYAIDADSIPAQADLEDGQTYEITATAATTGGAAGVTGDLAGFTADQLKTAFPNATPAEINADANAYLKYQFGLGLSDTMTAAPTLKIVDIAESKTAGYWDIKVQVLNGETPLAVDNGSEAETKTPLRATLTAIASATLEDFADAPSKNYELVFDSTTTDLTVTVPAADGQFFKAYIKYAVPANN